MSIDKNILYSRLERFIREYYHGVDKETILRLVKSSFTTVPSIIV